MVSGTSRFSGLTAVSGVWASVGAAVSGTRTIGFSLCASLELGFLDFWPLAKIRSQAPDGKSGAFFIILKLSQNKLPRVFARGFYILNFTC